MGFRNEELAQRERVEVLEREVVGLSEQLKASERQLSELKSTSTPDSLPKRRTGGLGPILLLLGSLVVLSLAVALGWRPNTHGDDAGIVLFYVALLLGAAALALGVISRFRLSVPPRSVLVLSGRSEVQPDGSVQGYRLVEQGRTWRMPFVEKAERMPLGPFSADGEVRNVYTKGNVVGSFGLYAQVRLCSEQRLMVNAVERFLGRPEEISVVAGQTLEGGLRELACELSLDSMGGQQAPRIAEKLVELVSGDLEHLGLQIDSLRLEVIPD